MGSIGFVVYPAIDLRNGQVVRLRQGDPGRQNVYSTDPAQVAGGWLAEGAEWLHVVNLDAAFGEEAKANRAALGAIVHRCAGGVEIQLGGGLRSLEEIDLALEAGAARVVVGTAAIEDPTFAARALERFGRQVAFALDAAYGHLKTHGWRKESAQSVIEFGRFLANQGASTVIVTDIDRDGMATGVDWGSAADLAGKTGLAVIASGGVASLTDIRNAKKAGLAGIIVGRALYEKRFTLSEALSC
jgi:phosphoribosylformimino-5-aminoimidazole carboxamide ribotide isomerase